MQQQTCYSTDEAVKRPSFIWRQAAKVPLGKIVRQLYTVLNTAIQRPPLKSGPSQLLPRLTLLYFIPLVNGRENAKLDVC